MAKLGYETFLLSHFNPIPDTLIPYCLNSTDLVISQFSLFQVPITKTDIFLKIQDKIEPMVFQQLDKRIENWNLSGLMPGKDGWQIPPSFLYYDPKIQLVSPSPAMEVSLRPGFDTFRKLSPADFKISEFITATGALKSRKDLSKAIKVSHPETCSWLNEYQDYHLIQKIFQFFNIGLDITVSFCITCPKSHEISWIPQFLSFPRLDLFFSETDETLMFFGNIKLLSKWYRDFTRKVHKLKKEFNDLKFYYSVDVSDIGKWTISLSDTYF